VPPARPRLLLGYDGSDVARAALRRAAELFPGSPIVIVTVWEPGLGAVVASSAGADAAGTLALPPDPRLVEQVDRVEEDHATAVAAEGARLARSLGLDAEPHPVPDEAHVADTIVGVAGECDAAVVVVGSHGKSGLRARLLGSTSRDVLARCPRPVLVVRTPAGSGD